MTQPKPLKVVHPSPQIAAPEPSSREQPGTPVASKMHVGNKRPSDSTINKSLSTSAKRAKVAVLNSAEELFKEMSVRFGLDKHWYESTFFPQLHAILQNQFWESLMA